MNVLNFFYYNPPKTTTNHNRKTTINHNKTIIKGAHGSGKKTLVLNHIKDINQEELLYIDETDIRFDKNCYENLPLFIKQNKIKTLIINEPNSTTLKIEKIKVENFYILTSKKDFTVDGFEDIWLDFLDFEEFLSSFKKNFNISSFFSLYILNGRMLKEESGAFLQNHLKINYPQNTINILKAIAPNIGLQTSVLEIFYKLKEEIKISKQNVFDTIQSLENEYMLVWVKNFHKNIKKPYFTNFALRDALSIKKDFKKTFENIVLCELFKLKTDIFYTNFLDFYLPKLNLGIICDPFLDVSLTRLRVKKIQKDLESMKIDNLIFITNNVNDSFENVTILPFYEWALGLE